jgi:hypothetical protein
MSDREEQDLFGPVRLPKHLPKVKPVSRIERRLIESSAAIQADDPDSVISTAKRSKQARLLSKSRRASAHLLSA